MRSVRAWCADDRPSCSAAAVLPGLAAPQSGGAATKRRRKDFNAEARSHGERLRARTKTGSEEETALAPAHWRSAEEAEDAEKSSQGEKNSKGCSTLRRAANDVRCS